MYVEDEIGEREKTKRSGSRGPGVNVVWTFLKTSNSARGTEF